MHDVILSLQGDGKDLATRGGFEERGEGRARDGWGAKGWKITNRLNWKGPSITQVKEGHIFRNYAPLSALSPSLTKTIFQGHTDDQQGF